MTATATHRDLPRGFVLAGAAIAVLLGLAALVIRVVTADPGQLAPSLLAGLALCALLIVPGGLAASSLRTGYRSHLAMAVGLLIVGAIPMFTLAPIALLALVLWAQAWSRWSATTASRPRPVAAAGALLAAATAVAALFVHLDPHCWEQVRTSDDDTVTRTIAPDSPSGFRWTVNTGPAGSATTTGGDVIATGCSSDRVVPAESIASLLFISLAAWAASRTRTRLAPESSQLPADSRESETGL